MINVVTLFFNDPHPFLLLRGDRERSGFAKSIMRRVQGRGLYHEKIYRRKVFTNTRKIDRHQQNTLL